MSRILRWAGLAGLVVASIVIILSLVFFVGHVVAGGCSMGGSSAALTSAQSGDPLQKGSDQGAASSTLQAPAQSGADNKQATPSVSQTPVGPKQPVPPVNRPSCH